MGTNEKEIAYSVITKIFNEKGVILNKVSDGTLKEMIQAVDIISRRTGSIKDQDESIISKYEESLRRMLSDYPELKP